jgi:hypothetical protein
MTIACACIDSTGRTAIGADRQVDTGSYTRRIDSKLRRWGPWTVASTGSTVWDRFLDAVRDGVPRRARWPGQLDEEPLPPWDPWSAEAFADAWYQWARARGHGDTSRGHVWLEGSWLLARHGEIVVVGADGAVCRPAMGDGETRAPEAYLAIGSGAAHAMGAMHARYTGMSCTDTVEAGVEAAIAHADGCGGRVEVVECEAPAAKPSPRAAWVRDHDRPNVWHRSADADGSRAVCGAAIPGSPLVVREGDEAPPTAARCWRCAIAPPLHMPDAGPPHHDHPIGPACFTGDCGYIDGPPPDDLDAALRRIASGTERGAIVVSPADARKLLAGPHLTPAASLAALHHEIEACALECGVENPGTYPGTVQAMAAEIERLREQLRVTADHLRTAVGKLTAPSPWVAGPAPVEAP